MQFLFQKRRPRTEESDLNGLDPFTLEIIKILTDVAGKIGTLVLSHRTNQIEKDKVDFYNRVKDYHRRVMEMLEKEKGSPKRLAEDIAKDRLFVFRAGYDNTEQICKALSYIDKLPKSKRGDRKAVLRALLNVFRNISTTSIS
jgi:hypothetical protein